MGVASESPASGTGRDWRMVSGSCDSARPMDGPPVADVVTTLVDAEGRGMFLDPSVSSWRVLVLAVPPPLTRLKNLLQPLNFTICRRQVLLKKKKSILSRASISP